MGELDFFFLISLPFPLQTTNLVDPFLIFITCNLLKMKFQIFLCGNTIQLFNKNMLELNMNQRQRSQANSFIFLKPTVSENVRPFTNLKLKWAEFNTLAYLNATSV